MRKLHGSALLMFGAVKVALGIATLCLASDKKPELIKRLAGDDETQAGKILEVLIVAFGVFTIVHGLAELDVWASATGFARSHSVQYQVFFAFGLFMTILYALVVYGKTSPVTHDPANRYRYLLYGVNGGLIFWLTIAVLYTWRNPHEWMWGMSWIALLLSAIVYFGLQALRMRNQDDRKGLVNDIVSLALIPLNAS